MNKYQSFKNICSEINHYPLSSELIYKYSFNYSDLNEIYRDKFIDNDFIKLKLSDHLNKQLIYWNNEKIVMNFSLSHDLLKNSQIFQLINYSNKEFLNDFVFSEIESSLAIEGIRSTRAQIEKLNNTDYNDLNEANDIIIKNMLLAHEFIKTNDISEENIFKLYEILSKKCLKQHEQLLPNNYYRHDEVSILDGNNTIVDRGVDNQLLPQLMKELIAFIYSEKTHDEHLIASHVVHFYILYLHPYFDYNGRMARVISLWYNYQFSPSLSLLLLSEAINDKFNKIGYYNAIMNSRKAGNDITYFLEYLGDIILKYTRVYINFYNIVNKLKSKDLLLNRSLELALKYVLVTFFSQKGYFSWKDYKNFSHDNFTKQYYIRLLNDLVDVGILEIIVHKNANFYKLKADNWDLF